MTDKNFDWVKFLEKLKDTTICMGIFISTFIILILAYYNKILIISYLFILILFLFLYSFSIIVIKLANIIKKFFDRYKYERICKINRLNELFNEIDITKETYKYYQERLLITVIYQKNLKTFSANELNIVKSYELYKLQNMLNDLCAKNGYYDSSILHLKGGKYSFYNCVWQELEHYEKNGIIQKHPMLKIKF